MANFKSQDPFCCLFMSRWSIHVGLAVFGPTGKLAVELSNIGLTMGCCVAFFVIIGDLLPPIVANMFGIQWVHSVISSTIVSIVFVYP